MIIFFHIAVYNITLQLASEYYISYFFLPKFATIFKNDSDIVNNFHNNIHYCN